MKGDMATNKNLIVNTSTVDFPADNFELNKDGLVNSSNSWIRNAD